MKNKTQKNIVDMRGLALLPFFAISFLIAWGVLALYIFAQQSMVRLFGNLTGNHPLFFLAVYAPAIAAIFLIFLHSGLNGIRIFISRVFKWSLSRGWTLFMFLALPVPFFLGAAVHGNLSSWKIGRPESLLVAMFMMLIKGPIEEIGWRGFALPLLQRHMRPLIAAIVLGIVWGIWHYPAFLLSGTPQSAWNFGTFFLGTVSLSVIVTPLFNLSRGSILVPMLFHFQMINPLWPDGQPYDTLFFIAMAAVITTLNWNSMWHGKDAFTRVLPNAGQQGEL